MPRRNVESNISHQRTLAKRIISETSPWWRSGGIKHQAARRSVASINKLAAYAYGAIEEIINLRIGNMATS